jgi:hypothetical protein
MIDDRLSSNGVAGRGWVVRLETGGSTEIKIYE